VCRRSQLLYTVFAGSNDLEALGVPHMVLRKLVHEKYHTDNAGVPVNDIAVFRVRTSVQAIERCNCIVGAERGLTQQRQNECCS
jgi:hypothetical protein